MIHTLFDNHVFIYIILALTGLGILMKLVVQVLYSKLLRASETMSTSNNKLAKNLKKKFEGYYKLKLGVNNVDIFVDKHFFYYKFCGIFLSTWERLCGQVLVLSLLVGAISTILGLIYECGKNQILSTFTVGILSCGLLIFLEGAVNPTGKKEMIRLNMKDYLENVLKVRLVQEENQPELMEQYKKTYRPSSLLAVSKDQPENDMLKPFQIKKKNKSKEAKRLEKMSQMARKKDEAAKKKESSKLLKIHKKDEAKEQRNAKKEARINAKRERELNARKQREAKRQEAARLKAEALEKEQRKKDEKQQQKELQKVLKLEKKHRGRNSKTTAQEKKENLLKEIQGRRSIEPKLGEAENKEENHPGMDIAEATKEKATDSKQEEERKADKIMADDIKEVKEVKRMETKATEVKTAEVSAAKVREIKPRQLVAQDSTYRDDHIAAALYDGRSNRFKDYEMLKPTSDEEEKIIEEILKDIFS